MPLQMPLPAACTEAVDDPLERITRALDLFQGYRARLTIDQLRYLLRVRAFLMTACLARMGDRLLSHPATGPQERAELQAAIDRREAELSELATSLEGTLRKFEATLDREARP